MIPTSIDGTDITGATIDGTDVTEITVDGQSVFSGGIPDSGDLHAQYDWSNNSTTTSSVPDLTGNGFDLTGSFTNLTGSINGVQAGEFDGSSDEVSVNFSNQLQPNTIFCVVQFITVSSTNFEGVYGGRNTAGTNQFMSNDSGGYDVFAGTNLSSSTSADTSPHIFSVLFDGTSSIIRQDGTQVASGDAGTRVLDGFVVGKNPFNEFANVYIGEILIYPQDKSSIFSDVEDFLSSKWGISV